MIHQFPNCLQVCELPLTGPMGCGAERTVPREAFSPTPAQGRKTWESSPSQEASATGNKNSFSRDSIQLEITEDSISQSVPLLRITCSRNNWEMHANSLNVIGTLAYLLSNCLLKMVYLQTFPEVMRTYFAIYLPA